MFQDKHIVLLKSRARNSGGLEKYATRIADGFAARGARVSILTTGDPPPSTGPIQFYPIKTAAWPSFIKMEQFDQFTKKWLGQQKVDLIFGMDRNRFQTHIRAGNGVHVAYLKSRIFTEGKFKHWVCLLNPKHRKILELERAAFENPKLQKLFTNSHMIRSEILEYYRVDPKKIEVVHNGVEWHEMASDFSMWETQKGKICQELGLDPNVFHFLFIGNGYLRKGLDKLLLSLSCLKMKDFHLSVIGNDSDQEQYQSRAEQLGLQGKVRFFGHQPHIRPFYQLADSLVIPSFYDPFANVTVEALAMGLFVVSSKHNGGHEILTPENGAIIEDLLSPDAMVASLEKAMLHRKTTSNAHAARQSAKHLDFSKQLTRLIEACG